MVVNFGGGIVIETFGGFSTFFGGVMVDGDLHEPKHIKVTNKYEIVCLTIPYIIYMESG
tara:strand:+ start:60 stop:236 length:177 start_codon:yes stop_codon:yes gene_type:complete